MSIKKPSQEATIENSPEGILLREMLDAQTDSKVEDELANAEALFKKSREEERERTADFAEWVRDTASQPHPELIHFEDDQVESTLTTESKTRFDQIEHDDAMAEPTADPDQIAPEVGHTVEPRPDQKEEKVENAERPL
jgi:hypothetical protein